MDGIIRGLPQRRYSYSNVRIDSSRWDHYVPREGDVVVATYPKNGTTWMEQIVLHLIHGGRATPTIHDVSVWVDHRKRRDSKETEPFPVEEMVAKIQDQTHRRQFKTHLPLDFLPYFPEVRYVVVGRSNRDVWLSWHNHYRNWLENPELPEDPRDFWEDWIEGRIAPQNDWDGQEDGVHPHFHYYQTWWAYRHLENILFVHFDDLLADLPREIGRVASFLGIDAAVEEIEEIARLTAFPEMKRDAARLLPGAKRADVFLNEGTNGRWREVLDSDDLMLYEQALERARTRGIDAECLAWLERQ